MADGAKPDPADLTAREALAQLASGALSAAALVDACLARIAAHDGAIRAFAHVDAEGARRAAEALDRHRRHGLPLGPLHGLPVGVKDIVDVAGLPCERGTILETGRVARRDATVAARLKAMGAIVVGKTVTTELASYPPSVTANPHDHARSPGGSSAGSAAAVAAGMVPLAIATQTNGSIVRPAAYCGAVGYKPTHGTIPATGVMPFAPAADHVGVIARTVEDACLVEHLAGPDGADPHARSIAPLLTKTAMGEPPMTPVLGFFQGPAWDRAADWVPAAFDELLSVIPAVKHIATPSALAGVFDLLKTVMAAESAYHLGHYLDRGGEKLHPVVAEILSTGRSVTAPDYLAARSAQGHLREALSEAFEECDALLTPATTGEAPGRDSTGDPAFCSLWSFTGLPAVTLPLMAGPGGLPYGVQLVGPHGDDARLLRTARWLVAHLAGAETADTPPANAAAEAGEGDPR
ncbi:MAG: amidase [Pseudomonadota bacterium]